MRQFLLSISIVVVCVQITFAQLPTLSEKAQISVLTCSSGDQLVTAFGHTAFRLQDPVLGIDVVYNYGVYDFEKPNFYLNFAKGKLIYSLSRRSLEAFLYSYELEKRWVKEQLINLDQEQVNQFFQFFEENYKPENRDYRYDPLFNNCSTIVADILRAQLGDSVQFDDSHLKELKTFRQLVHEHINTNAWGTFGIDLAFGGITDHKATALQHTFLPYYAMYQLNNSTLHGEPIVKRERVILDYADIRYTANFLFTPLFWFLMALIFVCVISYIDHKHEGRNRLIDFSLFFVSGLSGCIILLLWLTTDHVVTQQNFNFLWLLPTNVVVSFFLLSKNELPSWLKTYLKLALGLMALSIVIWTFKIQVQSPLNIILMLVLLTRYLFLMQKKQL